MFEGAVAGILNRLLGKYVQDLDTENLNVGIFSGNVNLTDLKLKPEALYELDLPIDVKIGTIGRINLQIPWSSLYTQPVIIHIEDVLVLVGPAISNSYFDPEREKRLTRAAKRKILQDVESESEILKGPQNFFESLFTAIVNNIQIYVRNVHVRYEDSISSKDGPLACGLCLQSLSIETTNSKWKPSVTPTNASTVYQMMKMSALCFYWNPTAVALDDVEIANITPMQYYNWKHYMLTGLHKFNMHQEDFEFLLKPVSCKVKVLINRSAESRVPRLLIDGVCQDSALQFSRRQYLSFNNLLASFKRIQLNRKYRHLHPGVPLSKNIKLWWRYAYNVVLEQRVRPYTWAAIKKHRLNYNTYKGIYKNTLRSPNDIELKLDLQKCEDSLPIIAILLAREEAKFELLTEEPDRIEVVESEYDWWRQNGSDSDGETEEPKHHVELCVKSSRSRSWWRHLSSPERERLASLIHYVEGEPRGEKSKACIEHKINLTLGNCSLTLINRGKEIVAITLTQFLASLETRPSAKAYKISARTESIVVEGINSDGDLVPILTAERSGGTNPNLLSVDFEKNPPNSEADFALSCLKEPTQVCYVEHMFSELISFFQTHSMTSDDLSNKLVEVVNEGLGVSKSVAVYAISRRKLFHIHVDVRGLCLAVPEGSVQGQGRLLIVDISRIIIKSDLQPSNLVLEDATCMELEERLYDRLHAECCFQIIFCTHEAAWREARKLTDSDLHVVPRSRAQLVFSNSIKMDYKLLPRFKLNLSLSVFKLNLSDRILVLLLDFFENLPLPVPNAVPMSLLDSGDYVDDLDGLEVMEIYSNDRIYPDPGYGELMKLRNKVVSAYMSRNRVSESISDRGISRPGSQQIEQQSVTSEQSLEEEVYARVVDLPGFDDNVSPNNNINTLLRFVVGEIVLNLSRSTNEDDRPFLKIKFTKLCVDIALLQFGPAVQLSVDQVDLGLKTAGQDLELMSNTEDLFNLLYRKVRADCPDFHSHFHSVEQALVVDIGALNVLLHAHALRTLYKYLQYVCDKIKNRRALSLTKDALPKTKNIWEKIARSESDPPVPPGSTKFSYSVRSSSVTLKLCHLESPLMELRLIGLESDCVFRANDRLIFKLFLGSMHLDDLGESTLYPKLIWPDEDKVLEVKYVLGANGYKPAATKPRGQLKVYLARIHIVLILNMAHHIQQFLEPLLSGSTYQRAATSVDNFYQQQIQKLKTSSARLNLAVDIHAPVVLIPQKPSAPNLLVFNLGELTIENFFKQLNLSQEVHSPIPSPVIDNILVKLVNFNFARAVMTLAGSLETQEPILEPLSLRCDIKRCVSYQLYGGMRDLLLCEAHVFVETILVNVGQKDLQTAAAVWIDNLAEGYYIGSMIPSSPDETDAPPVDNTVKKLQAFFAQGEPVRKEAVLRFSLDGLELRLFTDVDEILSSPVRDVNHGLAKLTAGEFTLALDYFGDHAIEMKAALASLLIEDIRPDCNPMVTEIFQSKCGRSSSKDGIMVGSPGLVEGSARISSSGAVWWCSVDRARLALPPGFVLALATNILPHCNTTGYKTEGGVINRGYVGDGCPPRNNNRGAGRLTSCSDCTSGYCSTVASVVEEQPSLSISIQFRQPEIMFVTDSPKSEGHALLLRSELIIDYSSHSNTESLVVSLANLQIISRLQSKLNRMLPQIVLKPCDVEFSRSFKNLEEGIKVNLSVSELEFHVAGSTVHIIMDILDDISNELAVPDEKEQFNFATYQPRSEKEDDLWAPKKIQPYVSLHTDDSYVPPRYSNSKAAETLQVTVPSVKVMLELENDKRVPIVLAKVTLDATLHDWSRQMHGSACASIEVSCYNEKVDDWEPLIEPVVEKENVYKPWNITLNIFQAKAYPMSARLDTSVQTDTEVDSHDTKKKTKRKPGFESETSADEGDTDGEMTYLKNPNADRNKGCNVEFNAGHMTFLRALDVEESDSENEGGLMDKLATAIGHLFTDDSSAEDLSNDDDSSAPEQSENEIAVEGEIEKIVSFVDGNTVKPTKSKRDMGPKSVTLQEPINSDSADSGLSTESFTERVCSYVILQSKLPLKVTLTACSVRAWNAFYSACVRRDLPTGLATEELLLLNDIGPGSTVELRTRAETDLAGNERLLAIADYGDTSRPTTPGYDTSTGDMLDDETEKKQDNNEDDDWDSIGFECNFTQPTTIDDKSPVAIKTTDSLLRRVTDHILTIKMHDMDQLTIHCPQRSVSKLHVLHPGRQGTRYHVVVDRSTSYDGTRICVRSPLQVRNETMYPLEVYYKKTELEAVGAELIGSLRNPFDDKMRIAVVAPHDTLNVPITVAYHCRLWFAHEDFQTPAQSIWWKELANDLTTPRDVVCLVKEDGDDRVFAMRVLAEEGCQSNKISSSIPTYLIRILPPLLIYNRLPYGVDISCATAQYEARLEAGERTQLYRVELSKSTVFSVHMTYMGMPCSASFTLCPELTERNLNLRPECETEDVKVRCGARVRARRDGACELFLYAPYWVINNTGLPIQLKGIKSDTCYEVTDSPLLYRPERRSSHIRIRAHGSAWSRRARLASAPALVVCSHPERRLTYRMLLTVTLSELCPQLTKIVTLLPFFLVYNETKHHLRFMEENEAADLWLDLAPSQCVPYWPQTGAMRMRCKYRDSTLVSQHFPIASCHFQPLRMDHGTAICVEVTGGTDRPFTISFKPYRAGDAPVRIDNLCEDLFLKLHQVDSGQVALLSPYQSMLYTWDDPANDKQLIWNIYNNKGKGYVADFAQDGYGEEKVSFHSVKHSTLIATNSVTSKLSSTLKRLTPRSPDPPSSSSDDSDSSDLPEAHTKLKDHSKSKKIRKDKVIVYWVSFMDGYQRVFALIQDEKIAYQYRMRINSERSNYEMYLTLKEVSFSVCVPSNQGVKELAYISLTDSLPRWEVNISHKWKQLNPDLADWIEDKYHADQKKCQLKEYIHIDLDKMQMTKPFFSELRRTYNPAVWIQFRKSDTYSYMHMKLQRLQIDNQLNEAVFPTVLHPAPLPAHIRNNKEEKPSIEFVVLKQYRPSLNQDVYKYIKIILQEHSVNLDRGFVNYVFDILNRWKIEEKPAVRLRADLALVHMPLQLVAIKSQNNAQRNIFFEYVHLSPIKIILSLSSRGYSIDSASSPCRRFGNKKENRPKLFNSDLLEYLFNSWGSSLCDMKDVVLKMSYLEVRNAPISSSALMERARRHYWLQLVQQFYVLVLGLNILGNPYSAFGDFTRGAMHYYEPHTGSVMGSGWSENSAWRVGYGMARLLGHCASGVARAASVFADVPALPVHRRLFCEEFGGNDLPDSVIEAIKTNQASVALALSGLIARPSFDICREASRACASREIDASAALRAAALRSGGVLTSRQRLPRNCPVAEGIRPYSEQAALGAQLLQSVGRGHYADTDVYVAHAHLAHTSNHTLLITTQHIFLVRFGGATAAWHIEWVVTLHELIGMPKVEGNKLVLHVKQDELVKYYSHEEKIVVIPDLEVLEWIRSRVEWALVLAMEDKRCPDQ